MTWSTGERRVAPALVVTLAVAVGTFWWFAPGRRGWFDAGVYYGAINSWVHGGGALYGYLRPGTGYGFTYPPFAAVCMLPMALLSWTAAIVVGVLLSVVAVIALLRWQVKPVLAARGWPGGAGLGLAACAVAFYAPVRDTFTFGQVNLVLLALVLLDLHLMTVWRSRFAGVGIGLAAAIKLTPAIFIGYLLVARRWREAAVATSIAAGATLVAAAVAPQESIAFWTAAMWHTDRLGSVAYVSNQSMLGMLARLDTADPDPSLAAWAVVVVAVAAAWFHRARRAARADDHRAGFALTGVAACLISPVTWVHHLVWLLPALIVLVSDGRRRHLVTGIAAYAVLTSSVVWLWRFDWSGVDGLVGGSAYTWICLGILAVMPIRGEARVDLVKGGLRLASRWLASARADTGRHAGPSDNVADSALAGAVRRWPGGQRSDRVSAGDGDGVGGGPGERPVAADREPAAGPGRVAGAGA